MCFEHMPGTYNSAEQKELCTLLTRGNKEKVREKKESFHCSGLLLPGIRLGI